MSDGRHATFSIRRDDGGFVGNVSLFAIDPGQLTAEIGCRITPAERGRGAATAAAATVAAWAFGPPLGLERIRLFHAVDNPGSCRVAVKSGFALEGVLRSANVYGDRRRHDEHLHARLRTDGAAP